MAYVRKTRDEFLIEQYTGSPYGWEVVCAEDLRREAGQRLREYQLNQPEYPVRVRKVRVKLSAQA